MFISTKTFDKYKEEVIQNNNTMTTSINNAAAEASTNAADLNALTARIEVLEGNLKEYLDYKKRKEADDPFIEILSETFDEKTGKLEMNFDWNPAMINFLKRNGYRGSDDDEIIMKYVSDMFNEKAINDKPTPIA